MTYTRQLYRTPRGRISNGGDLPSFIGRFPCSKAGEEGIIRFRSITELRVAEYLAWSPQVTSIAYERQKVTFSATENLAAIGFWPDFEIVLAGGEIEWVEAKYAPERLSEQKRADLELIAAHCKRENRRYRVVYRSDLERGGFISTISLLRRYGELVFRPQALRLACKRLSDFGAAYIEEWVRHAKAHHVPTEQVYHLLYHQQLPLLFRPLVAPELALCRS